MFARFSQDLLTSRHFRGADSRHIIICSPPRVCAPYIYIYKYIYAGLSTGCSDRANRSKFTRVKRYERGIFCVSFRRIDSYSPPRSRFLSLDASSRRGTILSRDSWLWIHIRGEVGFLGERFSHWYLSIFWLIVKRIFRERKKRREFLLKRKISFVFFFRNKEEKKFKNVFRFYYLD